MPATWILPFVLCTEYLRFPWSHKVLCAVARSSGRCVVQLLTVNVVDGRREVSGWHGGWSSFSAFGFGDLIRVAMNYRGDDAKLRHHVFYFRNFSMHFVGHLFDRLALVDRDPSGRGWFWPNGVVAYTSGAFRRQLALADTVIFDEVDYGWVTFDDVEVMWF